MAVLRVYPADAPLQGGVPVVADAHIARLAVLAAAQSEHTCRIRGLTALPGAEKALAFIESLGASVSRASSSLDVVAVRGRAPRAWVAPDAPLDCGADPALLYAACGALCGGSFAVTLMGETRADEQVVLARLLSALRARGASVEGRLVETALGAVRPPIVIRPAGRRLQGLQYGVEAADWGLKDALLLSGVFASGPTLLAEPVAGIDHAERMLDALGILVQRAGNCVSLVPTEAAALPAFDVSLIGSPSAAAYVLCASLLVGGSRVTCRRVGLNPTRCAFIEAAIRLGGRLSVEHHGMELGEPFGAVTADGGLLRATTLGGESPIRGPLDLPALLPLAAAAKGSTLIEGGPADADAARWVALLGDFGVEARTEAGAFRVVGRAQAPFEAAHVDAEDCPNRAICAVLLALRANGPSVIESADCIVRRFPRFVGTLRALGAQLEVSS